MRPLKASIWIEGQIALFETPTIHYQTLWVYTETSEKPHTSLSREPLGRDDVADKLLHDAGKRDMIIHCCRSCGAHDFDGASISAASYR